MNPAWQAAECAYDRPQPPPLERLYALSPTASAASRELIRALYSHPDAPSWNHAAGDRLTPADLPLLRDFAQALERQRSGRNPAPTQAILAWAEQRIAATPLLRRRIARGIDLARSWHALPTSSREDIAIHPEYLVPDDADLARMVIYRTAGTTGHALLIPHDPLGVACYQPLLSLALSRYGVDTAFDDHCIASFLLGAQRQTVTYPTAVAGWNGAGFAKLNLRREEWPAPTSCAAYLRHFAPRFLSGDPLSFADLLEADVVCRPQALLTTAVALSHGLKQRLEAAYACPVIDWYSLTETGPLGYACPLGHGYHWLPHDVHLETLTAAGGPTDRLGEITVSGGRNPFLPLLRYRTGDWGRIDYQPCPCGDPMPRLLDLEGRAPVRFRHGSGGWVQAQDIATLLRRFPLVQHSFEQDQSGACTLTYRALANASWSSEQLATELRSLLGATRLTLLEDAQLGQRAAGGKVLPFVSPRNQWLEE